jgi:hypothetical protein
MIQIERAVTASPRLSRIEEAAPQGLHEADPNELANIEGGFPSLGDICDTFSKITTVSSAFTLGGPLGVLIYSQT